MQCARSGSEMEKETNFEIIRKPILITNLKFLIEEMVICIFQTLNNAC